MANFEHSSEEQEQARFRPRSLRVKLTLGDYVQRALEGGHLLPPALLLRPLLLRDLQLKLLQLMPNVVVCHSARLAAWSRDSAKLRCLLKPMLAKVSKAV